MLRPPPPPTEEREPSPLDDLATKPFRPSWGPLPMFRGDVSVAAFLHDLISSQDAATRARSALLLGQIACPDSLELLAARLEDEERAVRVQAGIALACMGDPRGVPVCAAAIQTDQPWIRYYAAYGLWSVNSPRAEAVLRGSLRGQGPLVSRAIRGALQAPYVAPPPVPGLPQTPLASPGPTPEYIWEQAADVLTREADWWWHKGDYDQAIRCQEASILLDPQYVDAYGTVAWLEWSMGRNAAAICTLRRGIAAAPSDPRGYSELGHHYYITHRYELAEGPLSRSVALGGDHLARRSYAHCLERLGKLSESLEQWSALRELRPTDLSLVVNHERVKKLLDAANDG